MNKAGELWQESAPLRKGAGEALNTSVNEVKATSGQVMNGVGNVLTQAKNYTFGPGSPSGRTLLRDSLSLLTDKPYLRQGLKVGAWNAIVKEGIGVYELTQAAQSGQPLTGKDYLDKLVVHPLEALGVNAVTGGLAEKFKLGGLGPSIFGSSSGAGQYALETLTDGKEMNLGGFISNTLAGGASGIPKIANDNLLSAIVSQAGSNPIGALVDSWLNPNSTQPATTNPGLITPTATPTEEPILPLHSAPTEEPILPLHSAPTEEPILPLQSAPPATPAYGPGTAPNLAPPPPGVSSSTQPEESKRRAGGK